MNEEEMNTVDVEKSYSNKQVAAKLCRLADALDAGTPFEIQIAGNRVVVPPDALIEFEYTKDDDGEEVEIELKWNRP